VLSAIFLTSCIYDDPELNSQFFHDMAQSFSNNGDRPRGLWNNFGDGFFKGMAYGEQSKALSYPYDEYYDDEDYDIPPQYSY
jgi:hypothetical protein